MPPFEVMDVTQKALYWAKAGNDEHGDPVLSDPVVLSVRWNPKKGQALDPEGNTITTDASVVLVQDVDIRGIMWLWEDWTPTATVPTPTSGFMSIVTFGNTPSLNGRVYRKTAGLKVYSNTLPTLED